jgi:hypothetical protein
LKGIGAATAAKISFKGDSDLDRIYLYDDGCNPTMSPQYMNDYLKRLEILVNIQVD